MSIIAIPYPAASTVTEDTFQVYREVSTTVSEKTPSYYRIQGSFRPDHLIESTSITTAFEVYPAFFRDRQDEEPFYEGRETLPLPYFPPKTEKTIRVKVKSINIDREPPYIPPFDDAWFED